MLGLLYFVLNCLVSVDADPVVDSPAGVFKGKNLVSVNGYPVSAYKGIPYAVPPIGDLRFQKPKPVEYIENEYNAQEFKDYCIQMTMGFMENEQVKQSEDCLYLNIFTPQNSATSNSNSLKQVFVYFHGGGHLNGYTDMYDPSSFVSTQDLIVVTVAYRLGILGFLSNLSPTCPGNFGLWDQVEALRWIQKNIKSFGGNPEDVAIGGSSTGAIDAVYLSLSTVGGENLFSRVWAASGLPGVSHNLMAKRSQDSFEKVVENHECLPSKFIKAPDRSVLKLECLRSLPASAFSYKSIPANIGLGVVVDDFLLPQTIENIYSNKTYLQEIKFFDKHFLFGSNNNEGDVFSAMFQLKLESDQDTKKQQFLQFGQMMAAEVYEPLNNDVLEKVYEVYTKNSLVSPFADFMANIVFHLPMYEVIEASTAYQRGANRNVFVYEFVAFPEFMVGPYKGILHGMDSVFIFDMDFKDLTKHIDYQADSSLWNADDDRLKRKFQSFISGFLRTGDPNKGLDEELNIFFPPYRPDQKQYLEFSDNPNVKSFFQHEKMELLQHQVQKWLQESRSSLNEEL